MNEQKKVKILQGQVSNEGGSKVYMYTPTPSDSDVYCFTTSGSQVLKQSEPQQLQQQQPLESKKGVVQLCQCGTCPTCTCTDNNKALDEKKEGGKEKKKEKKDKKKDKKDKKQKKKDLDNGDELKEKKDRKDKKDMKEKDDEMGDLSKDKKKKDKKDMREKKDKKEDVGSGDELKDAGSKEKKDKKDKKKEKKLDDTNKRETSPERIIYTDDGKPLPMYNASSGGTILGAPPQQQQKPALKELHRNPNVGKEQYFTGFQQYASKK